MEKFIRKSISAIFIINLLLIEMMVLDTVRSTCIALFPDIPNWVFHVFAFILGACGGAAIVSYTSRTKCI